MLILEQHLSQNFTESYEDLTKFMRFSWLKDFTNTIAIRWHWPLLTMFAVQIGLYLWMAPRGFDFSDEPFYLLSYLYWREFTGAVTFFGAYAEWPFRAMRMSITGSRLLSLLLVLAGSAVLMREVLRFVKQDMAKAGHPGKEHHEPGWPYLIAAMASSMLYFGFLSTLRAPSYNLTTLAAMAFASACLLRTISQYFAGQPSRIAPFLYGIALGACMLSKATASLLMAILHLVFFITVNRKWAWPTLLSIALMICAGFGLHMAWLTVEDPGWVATLREGIQLVNTRKAYGMGVMLRDFSWDLQRTIMLCGPGLILLATAMTVWRRQLANASRYVHNIMTLCILVAGAVIIASDERSKIWIYVAAAIVFWLWRLEHLVRGEPGLQRAQRNDLALMLLLLLLPLAFAFGTNLSILGFSVVASSFAFIAICLRLYRLAQFKLLDRTTLVASLCLLCVPALVVQVRMLVDSSFTFRHPTALAEQNLRFTLETGNSTIWVDPLTYTTLSEVVSIARKAGFRKGQTIFDFSGDGPGLIYAIGAKPLGSAWLIGGFDGSEIAADRIIAKLNQTSLRNAWLLTSPNNPRHIEGWKSILTRHLGADSHKLIAEFSIRNPFASGAGEPGKITMQLWKPMVQTAD